MAGEKDRFILEESTTFPSQRRIVDQQYEYHATAMVVIATRFQGTAIKLALGEALKRVQGCATRSRSGE